MTDFTQQLDKLIQLMINEQLKTLLSQMKSVNETSTQKDKILEPEQKNMDAKNIDDWVVSKLNNFESRYNISDKINNSFINDTNKRLFELEKQIHKLNLNIDKLLIQNYDVSVKKPEDKVERQNTNIFLNISEIDRECKDFKNDDDEEEEEQEEEEEEEEQEEVVEEEQEEEEEEQEEVVEEEQEEVVVEEEEVVEEEQEEFVVEEEEVVEEEQEEVVEDEEQEQEEVVEEEQQEEEQEVVEESDDNEEVFEIEIDDITYFATDENNGILYAMDEDGDVGKEVGVIKDGEPIFN